MSNVVGECRVCGGFTDVVFNINLKQALICEGCSRSITLQQVIWWHKAPVSEERAQTEGYPEPWIHATIHLNPETGEMHCDGNRAVHHWILERISEGL